MDAWSEGWLLIGKWRINGVDSAMEASVKGFRAKDRATIRVEGSQAQDFLQGLLTTDVAGQGSELGYSALLTPQGKYLFDFFIQRVGDGFRIDVAGDRADALKKRLAMYRLRADVTLTLTDEHVYLLQDQIAGQEDPRHGALGSRVCATETPPGFEKDPEFARNYNALCVRRGIPRTGIELTEDSYILEAGFERLNGVNFKKGCYVGQEVTARMHHKTNLRKGLVQVRIDGQTPGQGTPITLPDGREAGVLFGSAGDLALAYLRLDRQDAVLSAGSAGVTVIAPVWELD